MDLSIIILNFKSRGLVRNCLRGLLKFAPRCEHEIIVVDNGSNDGTPEMAAREFPAVRCLTSPVNTGFGQGNNIGIREARGRYVMIMNPDTVIMDDALDQLVRAMDADLSVGIMGPRLQNPDGTRQNSCYRFPDLMTPVYRRTMLGKTSSGQRALARYLMQDFDYQQKQDVDWLLGASIVIRWSLLEKIGMFDPRFFLYFEDTDLCRRAWEAGARVVYNPEITIAHYHRRESAGSPLALLTNWIVREHLKSGVRYFWKYRDKAMPR